MIGSRVMESNCNLRARKKQTSITKQTQQKVRIIHFEENQKSTDRYGIFPMRFSHPIAKWQNKTNSIQSQGIHVWSDDNEASHRIRNAKNRPVIRKFQFFDLARARLPNRLELCGHFSKIIFTPKGNVHRLCTLCQILSALLSASACSWEFLIGQCLSARIYIVAMSGWFNWKLSKIHNTNVRIQSTRTHTCEPVHSLSEPKIKIISNL